MSTYQSSRTHFSFPENSFDIEPAVGARAEPEAGNSVDGELLSTQQYPVSEAFESGLGPEILKN